MITENNKKRMYKLETFNKLFMELLNDLSIIKPKDSTLLWVKTIVSMLDNETLVSQFMEYIGPFSDKILNRDESFFLNDLHKELEEDTFAAKEMDKVRTIWRDPTTSEDTKSYLWNYLVLLVKLGNSI